MASPVEPTHNTRSQRPVEPTLTTLGMPIQPTGGKGQTAVTLPGTHNTQTKKINEQTRRHGATRYGRSPLAHTHTHPAGSERLRAAATSGAPVAPLSIAARLGRPNQAPAPVVIIPSSASSHSHYMT